MHEQIVAQLSAYLDGELSLEQRQRVDTHLASCAVCRAVLDDLKAIVVTAPYYEGAAPRQDLWAGIKAGVDATREVPFTPRRAVARSFSLRQLVAASVAVAALSGTAVYFVQSRAAGHQPVPVAVNPPAPVSGTPAIATSATRATEAYDRAVGDLERVLAEGRQHLDPRTLKVIEDNLKIIDRAIAEARSAIAADPANGYLRSQVTANMRRKLDILRQASDVIRASES